MEIKKEWFNPLLQCVEALYIVDEKTRIIKWSNRENMVGESCFKAFLNRGEICPFCPELEEGKVYAWDYYDKTTGRWMKIKNMLFHDGESLVRAGNCNLIDDSMGLSHDSIKEMSHLQRLLSENKRIKESLEREATVDSMTGLFNRNRFNLDISSGMFDKENTGALYFDMNNLKEVNDNYRHEVGDRLICRLAAAIKVSAGQIDNSYCYRIGGDEFVMIICGCTRELLYDIWRSFDRELEALNLEAPQCIAAVGMAFSEQPCEAEKLVSAADKEMYVNKRKIKGFD